MEWNDGDANRTQSWNETQEPQVRNADRGEQSGIHEAPPLVRSVQ